ncbi:hypothetical protein [Corynebacterium pilosum]|uniref:Uncharacterized protein n=1 Tax=Corynebacterium pilosum TaxID=35756 RepID=A0A376CQH4_9CORY|nr:hypothetical protein [Corynebacterium pilosum]STC69908.1 Uncharacterised protein [Corynebacterium pilosum]
MRTAVTIIIFLVILVTGPLWFSFIIRAFPSETLEFLGGIITVAVAAIVAGAYWFLSDPDRRS